MLTLCIDETIDKQTGLCIVAGYLGKRRQWEKYVIEWRKELEPRNSLHLNSLRLNSLNAERHRELLKRLGGVPKRCGLRPFVGSICEQDYKEMVSGTVLEIIMEGYVLAILALLDGMARHVPKGERFEVIFEQQTTFAAQRERALITWQEHHKTTVGPSMLAKWRQTEKNVLTEAPDYLCYALYQKAKDRASKKADLTSPILQQQYVRNHITKARAEWWINEAIAQRGRPLRKTTPELRKAIRYGFQ